MPTRRNTHSRGSTVLEGLIAIGLLTLVLPGLVLMTKTSGRVQKTSIVLENAVAVGQAVLDSLSLVPAPLLPSSGSTERIAFHAGYEYRTVWWYTPSTGLNGTVHAEVSWVEDPQQHKIHLVGGAR